MPCAVLCCAVLCCAQVLCSGAVQEECVWERESARETVLVEEVRSLGPSRVEYAPNGLVHSMNTDGKGIQDICALTACKLVTLHPVAAVQQHIDFQALRTRDDRTVEAFVAFVIANKAMALSRPFLFTL